MFDKYFNPRIPFVAIDLSDRSIKAARVRQKGKKKELIGVGKAVLPEGLMLDGRVQDSTGLAEKLREFFKSGEGKKLEAVGAAMTLPEEHCFGKISHVPNLSEKELEQAVQWEAESVIPLPPNEAIVSWELLGPSIVPGRLDVLIAGVPRDLAASYADLLRSIPLIPVAFEPESFSIARALINAGDGDAPLLICDLGNEHTGVIITAGGHVRVTANIAIAAKMFTKRIAAARKIKSEEAEDIKRKYGIVAEGEGLANRKVLEPVIDDLIRQIRDFFRYFESHGAGGVTGKKITKVLLAGGDAMLKGLPEYMAQGLQVPVEIGDAYADADAVKGVVRHPLYTSAIGLALYDVDIAHL